MGRKDLLEELHTTLHSALFASDPKVTGVNINKAGQVVEELLRREETQEEE